MFLSQRLQAFMQTIMQIIMPKKDKYANNYSKDYT